MQLTLEISTQKPPSFENFMTGRNEELIELLHQIAQRDAPERFVYLWGEPATGKTHLLKALAEHPPVRYIDSVSEESHFLYDEKTTLYLLDDCDRLSPEKQIAAFNLFNDVRENTAFLVAAGETAASRLPVRDDLKSRMGWGVSYRIHGLTDQEKMDALKKSAQERGFSMSVDVLPYLITHYPRDMHSLLNILDALDRYSLQTKRAVTLPLLREMMQTNATLP